MKVGANYGTWTCVKIGKRIVVLRCDCGVEKTEHIGTWRNKTFCSRLCRACLIKRENKRISSWFTKKNAG